MKAKRLTLTNYRGFQKLEIEFGNTITVLAGVNGSGKSAVLRALAAVLSHLLPKVTSSKESPETFSAGDVHTDKPALTVSATFQDADETFHTQLTRAVTDKAKAKEYSDRRDKARFAMRETKKGSKEEKALLDEIRFLNELLEQDKDHFSLQTEDLKHSSAAGARTKGSRPIAVLYATSRYLGRMPPRLSGLKPFEPGNAYPEALSGAEVSLSAFASWFQAALHGALGSNTVSKRLLRQLDSVISTILPGFSDPRLTETSPPKFHVKKNGKEFELNQLSDGERGLLALVFDLTRRLAISNPELKDPVAESSAIVLLDEIELHLHPSWQRNVLRRLSTTFKNCQFIVTTHSPQVIGQSKPANLRLLGRTADGQFELQPIKQSFGMDSNWVLQEIMGTPPRDYLIERKLSAIHDAIDDGHLKKARGQVKALEKSLGLFPELQEMKSMLDRFEMLKRR
jgi:predicted ATP-dependent endonuclease of OLD family